MRQVGLLPSPLLLLGLASLMVACGPAPRPSPAATVSAEASPQATPGVVSGEEMTEAMSVRTRFGLRADDAWIRSVAADPAAQVGMSEFGIPLLPAEFADLMSRRWDEDLLTNANAYGLLFPEDYAGAYINLKASGVVVEFKDQIERHRKALANLAADPGLVEVRQVAWSLKDLEGFTARVEAARAWFDTIGVRFLQVGHRVNENFIHVDFTGPDEAAVAAIEDHFGNPTWLKALWDGPPRWAGPRADLVIKLRDTNGRPVRNVWCDVLPEDQRAIREFQNDSFFGAGDDGICALTNFPVVAYKVRLHTWVDNDHYDPHPIKEFRVVLSPAGTVVSVVIPAG